MEKIAHIFPGQGAYSAGALKRARFFSVAVENAIGIAEAVSQRRLGRSLTAAMWDKRNDVARLMKSDPALLQLAIFTVAVAAHDMLGAQRVEPDILMGHSFGEIAALTCAGVFSIEQGAEIVCDRVEALAAAAPSDGVMAAISASPPTVRAALEEWSAGATLAVAVENHDAQTVVSGAESEVAAFVSHCKSRKLSAQKLNAPYGFHHPSLAPVTAEFAARLDKYPQAAPCKPVYSPILGRYYRRDDAFGECLAQHLTMPVAFSTAVRRLHADGVSVFIECGALDGLTKIVARILGRKGAKTFSTFTPAAEDGGSQPIVTFIKENRTMNAMTPTPMFPDFEAFWRERSPFILALIKSEFTMFLMQQRTASATFAPIAEPLPQALDAPPRAPREQPAAVPAPAPSRAPIASTPAAPSRGKLLAELVAVYAEAMEYPPEVFTETVELEAELGIDSVKQAEIMGRIGQTYGLPKLPANVRISDFKTMGQIVDLVVANRGKAPVAA